MSAGWWEAGEGKFAQAAMTEFDRVAAYDEPRRARNQQGDPDDDRNEL